MSKITFITTNKHKVLEAKAVLKEFDIKVEHLKVDYPEDKEGTIHDVVIKAIQPLANKLKKPVVIEDTGLFFEAFVHFPGLYPKYIFESLGYKGILKLLKNENNKAFFLTVVGYCEPNKEPELFEGKMPGIITDKVFNLDKDAMPYDRIFIPNGYKDTISHMPMDLKNSFSQRAQAFRKLGKFLTKKVKV
tara:strand:+ start:6189 stop:6758 length:570 start_codon:yes stop_codon:yes gene_type:complete